MHGTATVIMRCIIIINRNSSAAYKRKARSESKCYKKESLINFKAD